MGHADTLSDDRPALCLGDVFGPAAARFTLPDAPSLRILDPHLAGELMTSSETLRAEASRLLDDAADFVRADSVQPDIGASPMVVLSAPDATIQYCSPALAALLGYESVEALISTGSGFNLLAPSEQQEGLDDLQNLLATGHIAGMTYHLIRKNGALCPVEIHASALVDAHGSIQGLISIVRDIPSRMPPQALAPADPVATSDWSVAWVTLFNQSPIGMVVAGLDGRCLAANPAFCRMIGYSAQELAGQYFHSFTHPDDLAISLDKGRQMIEGKLSSFQVEKRYLHKDGHTIWASLSASVIRNTAGEPLAVLSQIQDITALKTAERQAKMSLARYRAVVEDQTELICRYLPDTTLTFVNEAYCRYFGRERRELLGRRFAQPDFIPAEQLAEVQDRLSRLSAANPLLTHEHLVRRADGALRWMQWIDRAIVDETGQVIELQAIGRDITERREMEEALRVALDNAHQREIEARDLARQLAGARDDERNCVAERLHSTIGHLLLTLQRTIRATHAPLQADPARDAQIRASLEVLDEIGEQVRALVIDLDSSVLEQSGIAAAGRRYVERMAASAHQTICFHTTGRVRRMPIEIERVLFRGLKETLTNALRHARAAEISAQLHIGPHSARLTVQDDGIGFDPALAEPDNSVSQSFGLPGLRRQVRLLAGDFRIDSAPGRGSTVIIELPLPADPPHDGQRLRILIADAHDVLRRGLAATLAEAGEYECAEAADGLSAVHLAEISRVDVALVAFDLPELGGIEVARQIAATTGNAAVILMSFEHNEEMVKQLIEAGARGFLLKSAGSQEVLRAVRAVRAGERYFSPPVAEIARRLQSRPDIADAARRDALASLTAREREILHLIVNGYRNRQVADRLGISVRTVEVHRRNIMDKLGVRNLAQLVQLVTRRDGAHLQ